MIRRYNPDLVYKHQQQTAVMALRVRGHSYDDIAKAFHVSSTEVAVLVQSGVERLKRLRMREAESSLEIELARIDIAIRALAPTVETGNVVAIDKWTKLIELRSKLLGLITDKHEVSGGNAITFNVIEVVRPEKLESGQPDDSDVIEGQGHVIAEEDLWPKLSLPALRDA
jgi:hypothetical protein